MQECANKLSVTYMYSIQGTKVNYTCGII